MRLELKANHFKDTNYHGWGNFWGDRPQCGCAIDKALDEILPGVNISEGGWLVRIDGRKYKHEDYTPQKFEEDKSKAYLANYDPNVVIRTIEIPDFEPEMVSRTEIELI